MKTLVKEGNDWVEYKEDGSKVKLGTGPTPPTQEAKKVKAEVAEETPVAETPQGTGETT